MRCLVTGADGFLGANLCKLLLEQGHEVTASCLYRREHTSLDALGVKTRIEYGNVLDYGYVRRLINAYEIDTIFHLAGVSIVRIANRDPYRAIETNVLGTLNVCNAGQDCKILVASSDKAYGDNGGESYTEDTPLRPKGAYEVSKACADHVARLYGAIVVRAANLYGPADLHWSRLVPGSCRRVLSGKPPEVYGDAANYEREWMHVRDAARAYLFLAKYGNCGEAYNISGGESMTPLEVANTISRLADPYNAALVSMVDKKRDFYEIPIQSLDCSKIDIMGCTPQIVLMSGLEETLDWYDAYLNLA